MTTLTGIVESDSAGETGFDTDDTLDLAKAKLFYQSGYRFCLRYLSLSQENPKDLTNGEANAILNAGLALMPVQHVLSQDWRPSTTLGENHGKAAVENARTVGFPSKVNVWLDLEGIDPQATVQDVVNYCNNWFDQVNEAGYLPGLYVGANSILNSSELYKDLKFQYYWHSLSIVPDVAVRGYQMTQQRVRQQVHSISIDKNTTHNDNLNGSVQWLIRKIDSQS